jgi:hypothetical protein
MNGSAKEIVYSNNVIEFVAVANEYCHFVENTAELTREELLDKSVKLMSLVYLKASLLPDNEPINEESNEKFVTEFDWQFVHNGIEQMLGNDDTYLDFFDNEMNETPEPVASSISENMADIYQDLKDFLEIYKLENDDLSNDALYECKNNFGEYWGFRLVNSMRIIHYLRYKKAEESDNDVSARDTKNWFISRAQQDFQSND